jgi:pilus assembly protein FimV
MPRVRRAAVPLLAVLLPLTAGALGLGEISLRSALNQPFVAEIPVTSQSGEDLSQVTVELAPGATFARFGLDRPRFLDDFRFQIQREGTRTFVRVTSTQPVSEPFVSMLLDIGWPQGRLLREFTVLLDPPTFARPDSSGQVSARPAAPPAAAGPAPAPVIRRAPAPEPAASRSGASGSTGSITSGPAGDTYGPVRSNETLWRISERLSADSGVSLNQMMLALFRANPEAFAGNINRLRRGAILRVPRGGELTGISSREALAEVRRQNEEWRGAAASAPVPARLQLVPPAEQKAASAPSAGTPGTAGSADRAALERELAEKQRLLSLKDSQLKALQDRLSQLEGQAPPDAAPPVAGEAPAELPDVAPAETPAEAPAETPVPESQADGTAVPPVAAGQQAAGETSKPARRAAREQPAKGGGILGSLSGLIFNVWFLVSAAAVLLAGLFFVFGRRRMAAADEASRSFDNDMRGGMRAGAGSTQPVVRRDGYSVEEGAADRSPRASAAARTFDKDDGDAETPLERTISTEGAVELDQADVVAEADFHLAYGLYDQAAELLLRALRDTPDRRDLRLKLIEVYFVWENKAAFLKEAQTFHRQLGGASHPDWNKVVILGKQICPGEALFAGAVASTGDSGIDLALDGDDDGSVDFSLDEGGDHDVDLDLTAARKGPAGDLLDLDFGLEEESSVDDTGLMKTAELKAGGAALTAEVPTIEAPQPGDYAPTMETPTIESRGPGESTMETPTLESAVPGGMSSSAAESLRGAGVDQTEEINLEDLGLDLTGLDEAAGDLGTGVHGALDSDDDASGGDDDVYDLVDEDDEESDLLQGLEGDATAEMRGMALDEGTLDLPAFGNAMEKSASGKGAATDSTSRTAEHRAIDDTAEQPRADSTGLGDVSGELSEVDFDIGDDDDAGADLEPTSVMTGRRRGPEGPTMTEVGTKLDLARAYVDMGDPDGARSILNEVLEEGDSAQRQEARRLLDDLTA